MVNTLEAELMKWDDKKAVIAALTQGKFRSKDFVQLLGTKAILSLQLWETFSNASVHWC